MFTCGSCIDEYICFLLPHFKKVTYWVLDLNVQPSVKLMGWDLVPQTQGPWVLVRNGLGMSYFFKMQSLNISGSCSWVEETWNGRLTHGLVKQLHLLFKNGSSRHFCYHSFGVFVDITAAWQQTQKCVYKKKEEALKVQLLLEHFDPTHGQRIHL